MELLEQVLCKEFQSSEPTDALDLLSSSIGWNLIPIISKKNSTDLIGRIAVMVAEL